MSAPRVCLVGPLPPPAGGMAVQCAQLLQQLRAQGLRVELVQTNRDYQPAWLGQVPLLRAAQRLLPYGLTLWQALGRADVVHVLANSGWAWYLFATPALLLARLRGVAAIVRYHGGQADAFFSNAPGHVHRLLQGAALRVLPSPYLQRVFMRHGLSAEVIPNGIDLTRFRPRTTEPHDAPVQHILVSRNLDAVYDIASAIRAFARIHHVQPHTRLTIAGGGPELARLQAQVAQADLQPWVDFVGRIDNRDMATLLATAACLLNPSRVDNMPVSILEAFACGVPVVSTRAGGIPDMLQDGRTGLLVPVGDDAAMAAQVLRVLQNPFLAQRLRSAALEQVAQYSWPGVTSQWLGAYRRAAFRSAQ